MTTQPGNHILPHYDQALNNIQTRVLTISATLLQHMEQLERAIASANQNEANGIIAAHDSQEEETRQILSLCAAVLTQFHPLGSDLRLIISFSRCGDKLKECADELLSLARHAKNSIRQQTPLSPDILLPLLHMAAAEFRDAVECLKNKDSEAAGTIQVQDKKLDKAHRKALALLVTPDGEQPPALNVHLLFMIRSIERIGDIAKSIAATVIFLKEARDIRHGKKK